MKYDLPKIDRAHVRTLLNFSFNKEIVTLTLKQIFKTLDESFNSENNSVGVSDKDLKSELRFISNLLEILSQ